jgi:uncharacterized protein with HEPN domain
MRRDDAYLLDILIAARRARRFLEDLTWEEFVHSELHQDAVMRPLAIIGEAARQVSQETRDAHPELPWPQMAGMRNRLIHEYFRVDLATVWETVKNDLPPLIAAFERLVPPEEELYN